MHIMGGQRRGWPDYCGLDLSCQSGTLNEPCTTQDMDIAAIKKHNKLPMIIKDLICGRWGNFLQSTGKKYKGFPSSTNKTSLFPWLLKVFLMWLSVATGETWHPIAFPIGENNVGSASQKWFGQIGCFLLTQPSPDHASPCPLLWALSKSSHNIWFKLVLFTYSIIITSTKEGGGWGLRECMIKVEVHYRKECRFHAPPSHPSHPLLTS